MSAWLVSYHSGSVGELQEAMKKEMITSKLLLAMFLKAC
jgi:hypothetical protein